MSQFAAHRALMMSNFPDLDRIQSDQKLGRPQPPLEKPVPEGSRTIPLPAADSPVLTERDVHTCLRRRRSRRSWVEGALTLEQVSFLLWATQGVQRVFGHNYSTFRPVPSGGARHPFETYLAVNRVDGLTPGLYRYLPLAHALLVLRDATDLARPINDATLGQTFVGDAPVIFFWSCLPYRGEWRYHSAAHKIMLLDAGHLCQNLYLACEAVGCGTCAIAAYDQRQADALVGVDGVDEFVVYLAPVGKARR
jgi:SagB-type dehydrogenase family enzyme